MLTIRRAWPGEADTLSALAMLSKAVWGYDADFMEACREELSVKGEHIRRNDVWLAELDRRIAGFYELIVESGERLALIRMFFVGPEFQGQGVGGGLWAHMEGRVGLRGVTQLMLDADPNAVAFYERFGMTIVGETPSGSIPGRLLPVMAKQRGG